MLNLFQRGTLCWVGMRMEGVWNNVILAGCCNLDYAWLHISEFLVSEKHPPLFIQVSGHLQHQSK